MSTALWRRAYWSLYTAWHFSQQARLPFLSLSELEARRDGRVREMVAYAYRWVPYYRETMQRLGLTPDDFVSADDLRRLPLIDKSDLQASPLRFRSTQFGENDLLKVRSGGSTGEPHNVWHDASALFQSAAHSHRDESIIDALIDRPGPRRELSLGAPHGTGVEVRAFTRERAIYPRRPSTTRLTLPLVDLPAINLPKINAFRPDVIRGYGSYFGRLFEYARDSGMALHRPAAIVFVSEGMPDRVRQMIEQEYGLPVFGLYQTIEAFKIGFECEAHCGYHINIDNYVLRVVDDEGQDLPPGETGEAVVSNLVNRGTVLLNMRLGDMVRWAEPRPCACGRTLPMLDAVQGRLHEWIRMANGELLHPQLVAATLSNVGDIRRYQAVQLAPDLFELRIIPERDADRTALAARAQAQLAARLGEDTRFCVRFVDELDTTLAGKTRSVIGLGNDATAGC